MIKRVSYLIPLLPTLKAYPNVFGRKPIQELPPRTRAMAQFNRCSSTVLLITFLFGVLLVAYSDGASTTGSVAARHPYHEQQQPIHKVRGDKRPFLTKRRLHRRRILKGGSSHDSTGAYSEDKMSSGNSKMSGKGGSSSSDKKSSKSNKGGKTSKSKRASNKSGKQSGNIFDHSSDGQAMEMQEVQVQCGTDESPFLTTFVASIRLHEPKHTRKSTKSSKGSKRTNKSTKGSTTQKSTAQKESVQKGSAKSSPKDSVDHNGDDDQEGDDDAAVAPMDDLTRIEQRILEQTFREVYNNWTFENCDGFFRTVYTVSMTMVERDEAGEDYAVTLENMYRDGGDEVTVRVVNGTMPDIPDNTNDDNDFNTNEDEDGGDMGEARWLQTIFNNSNANHSAPTKEVANLARDGPAPYDQTISGGDDLPIYYVSLAATCRNCEVTDEVNFPLLMIPESERRHRTLQAANIAREEEEEGEICTCSLPVEDNEVEISRRRLDGHDLFVPQPMGPTPEQYIQAMNSAIQNIQRTEGQLLRIEGIEDLIEPDYFNGENPEREIGPTNAPTVSAMPSVSSAPSTAPTISAAPTASAMPSSEAPIPTPAPTTKPLSRPPSDRPTIPPITLAPTEVPATRSSVHGAWALTMTALLGFAVTGTLWV